ncbi:MAG: DUF632 domain-containing protein [Mollicutes bacterium]|nr:DUF632 domain-containing protein [Mollicutes bacterium]
MEIGVISGLCRYWWFGGSIGGVIIDEQTYYEKMIEPLTPELHYDHLMISYVDGKGNLQTQILTKNFSSKRHFFGEVILYDKETGEVLSLDEEPMNLDDIDCHPEKLINFTDVELAQVVVLIQAYKERLSNYEKSKRIIFDDSKIHFADFGGKKRDIDNNWKKHKQLKAQRENDLEYNKMLDYKIREIKLLLKRVITISKRRIENTSSIARIRFNSL